MKKIDKIKIEPGRKTISHNVKNSYASGPNLDALKLKKKKNNKLITLSNKIHAIFQSINIIIKTINIIFNINNVI